VARPTFFGISKYQACVSQAYKDFSSGLGGCLFYLPLSKNYSSLQGAYCSEVVAHAYRPIFYFPELWHHFLNDLLVEFFEGMKW
jgi:hypothetical protein